MGYLTALLLALPLAAQEPQPAVPVSTAPPAAQQNAVPPGKTVTGPPPAELAEAALCIDALRGNWAGSDEGLALAISSAAAFIAAGAPRALPPEAGAELERQLTAMRDRAASARAVKDLSALRRALQNFFADTGGRWPASLDELVPGYLPSIPALDLPGHAPSAGVKYVTGKLHDKDIAPAAADTGGWLYFSDPASDNWGLVLIDCSHANDKGTAWHDR